MPRPITRFATKDEKEKWDELVPTSPGGGQYLSSIAYTEIKKTLGWRPRFIVHETDDMTSYSLALEKSIFPLGKFWYFPAGPNICSPNQIRHFMGGLRKFIQEKNLNIFAVRIEPQIPPTDDLVSIFKSQGLVKSLDIQVATSTIIVDLSTGSAEKVFNSFPYRGKRQIRKALKEGICEVREVDVTEKNMQILYHMLTDTLASKKVVGKPVPLWPYDYYRKFWTYFSRRGKGRLYFLFKNDTPYAGAYIITYGNKAIYKDGGSLREKISGGGHLLQWKIMEDLLTLSTPPIVSYDLYGSPPSHRLDDPDHRFADLAKFKTSFSKDVCDYAGGWDYPLGPRRHWIWRKVYERFIFHIQPLVYKYVHFF